MTITTDGWTFSPVIDTMDLQQQQTDLRDIFTERTSGAPSPPPDHKRAWSRSSVKEQRHENQKHF